MADEVVERTRTNVSLPFNVIFFGPSDGVVVTNSSIALDNLTIVYQYTRVDDNSTVIQNVEYGSFVPAWGAGVIIDVGQAPEANFRIPHEIFAACATTAGNDSSMEPNIKVLSVYGYA